MKTKLTHALELAERGFHIFPLVENSKTPRIKGFPTRATTNKETIELWWKDPVLDLEKDFNIGISTTRYKNIEALIVIDVDNKNGKDGDGALLELELEGFELPKTLEFTTPTGGRHLVF